MAKVRLAPANSFLISRYLCGMITFRQRLMKLVYPVVMALNKFAGKSNKTIKNTSVTTPNESFYDLEIELNNGSLFPLSQTKGRKVLIVNTASDCGYTGQYKELQELWQKFSDKLVVIGFPSNDFKEQEKGSDEEIAAFCQVNYGVTFPLAKKSAVTGNEQNPVFRWLSDKKMNGWNDQVPAWNFSKYLVNEEGVLVRYFDPGVSPMSNELLDLLKK